MVSKITRLQKWYNSLPSDKKIDMRDKIIAQTGKGIVTFYNYLSGTTNPSKLIKERIALIAGKQVWQLFPKTSKK